MQLNKVRAYFYEFLARILSFANNDEYKIILEQARFFYDNLEDLKEEFKAILDCSFDEYKKEQNAVFYDFSYVNVPFDASFYDEGRDNGQLKIKTIKIFNKASISKNISDNEDSFNVLFFAQAYFCKHNQDEFAKELFADVINCVINEFSQALKEHKSSILFAHIAKIIDYLVDIERLHYSLSAPSVKKNYIALSMEKKPFQTRLPTQFSKINMQELTSFKEHIDE